MEKYVNIPSDCKNLVFSYIIPEFNFKTYSSYAYRNLKIKNNVGHRARMAIINGEYRKWWSGRTDVTDRNYTSLLWLRAWGSTHRKYGRFAMKHIIHCLTQKGITKQMINMIKQLAEDDDLGEYINEHRLTYKRDINQYLFVNNIHSCEFNVEFKTIFSLYKICQGISESDVPTISPPQVK